MTTTAARVEVLTAEVRVLMVGSRQITLSVYRQLDYVNPVHLDPFGRVNASRSDPDAGERIEAVGASTRDRDAGALVRSNCRPGKVYAGLARTARSNADRARRGVCEVYSGEHAGRVTAEEFDADAAKWDQAAAFAAQWEALPLIVLAGLR